MRAFKLPSALALECTLKKIPTNAVEGAMKKSLTVSAVNTKRFVISDHYEFDRKVSANFNRRQSKILTNFHFSLTGYQ